MIARLTGEVVEVEASALVVECGGVGYQVAVPSSLALAHAVGDRLTLVVRQLFREDDVSLYGFADQGQRRLFDLLRGVKGCGPKISLAVIDDLGEDGATRAISAQDTRTLAKVSGIGPRLAERIAMELKDKVGLIVTSTPVAVAVVNGLASTGDELVDALMTLGYRRPEAEQAAAEARAEHESEADQLRAALRSLKK